MANGVDETVVDDVRRRQQDPASVAGDDDGAAATSGQVWVMDLLDYYTDQHANSGPRARDDAVPLALQWRRTQRHRGPQSVRRKSTELELQTAAAVDLDGSRPRVTPAGPRTPRALDPDGDDERYRRLIRPLADRLMSNEPCACDTPDGCPFYANVTSVIMAEARAAFGCRATKTRTKPSTVAATAAPGGRRGTTSKILSAWNAFRRVKNTRKPDERADRKKSTNNVKYIQVAYKK